MGLPLFTYRALVPVTGWLCMTSSSNESPLQRVEAASKTDQSVQVVEVFVIITIAILT
jgi:hypothetical protein